MKLNILTTAALLAIAGAVMTQSAKAQLNSTNGAPAGDLILGFSNGGTTDYEIDLGAYTLYTGNTQIAIANVGPDLSADYGSTWFSNTNLQFAIGGAPSNDALISNTSSTSYTGIRNSGIPSTTLANLYVPENTTPTPTAGLLSGTINVSSSNMDNITGPLATAGFAFGTASSATFGSGAPALYVDLISPGSGSGSHPAISALNGPDTFSIQSNGELYYDYTPMTVPEPSTYALCVAGLVLLVALKRRKSVTTL